MSEQYSPGSNYGNPSAYGWRTDSMNKSKQQYHGGVDMAAPLGTPVPAAANGIVWYSGPNEKIGNTVIIQHTGADGTKFYKTSGSVPYYCISVQYTKPDPVIHHPVAPCAAAGRASR